MPRFTGGAVGALAYDAVSIFEPTVPLPERDPVGVADGGLHRDRPRPRLRPPDPHARRRSPRCTRRRPDLEGRYRIAEEAIFEALERTARPDRGRDGAAPARRAAGRRGEPRATTGSTTSLGRDEYIRAVEVAKDAIAAGEAIQVVLARRQSFDLPADPATGKPLDGIGLYRTLRRVNPSPYLFFVRTPAFEVVGASPELLVQVDGDKLDDPPDRRHPPPWRRRPRRTRSSPSSSSATRRSAPST